MINKVKIILLRFICKNKINIGCNVRILGALPLSYAEELRH